jgi:hypothetical protein
MDLLVSAHRSKPAFNVVSVRDLVILPCMGQYCISWYSVADELFEFASVSVDQSHRECRPLQEAREWRGEQHFHLKLGRGADMHVA